MTEILEADNDTIGHDLVSELSERHRFDVNDGGFDFYDEQRPTPTRSRCPGRLVRPKLAELLRRTEASTTVLPRCHSAQVDELFGRTPSR